VTAWGKRSKVRLHSGGISPSEVRLRRRGASEKKTAPGRDIRDIAPDPGPRFCRHCGTPFPNPAKPECHTCLPDRKLIDEVKRELARQKQPPLGVTMPPGSPYAKKRRQAEAALERIRQLKTKTAKVRPSSRPAKHERAAVQDGPSVCTGCFTELPRTRRCDSCHPPTTKERKPS